MEDRLEELDDDYTYEDYISWDESERIEIIDGEIYNQSSPFTVHQDISQNLFSLVSFYIKQNSLKCACYYAPMAVILEKGDKTLGKKATVVEPDLFAFCDISKLKKDGYHGAPDLVIEITNNKGLRKDKVKKLDIYIRYGVREYWVVNYESRNLSVYNLETTIVHDYYKEYYDGDTLESGIFPGLTVNVSLLFDNVFQE